MSCMTFFLSFVVKVHSVSHVTTTVCVKPYALFDLPRYERPAVRRILPRFSPESPPSRAVLGRRKTSFLRHVACAQRTARRLRLAQSKLAAPGTTEWPRPPSEWP